MKSTPQNSSKPPSTEHPHAKTTTKKPKSKKNRGGQPGQTKRERELIPTAMCDTVIRLKPQHCRRCRHKLTGIDDAQLRHQVSEIPEIKPHITEYQRHRLICQCCGEQRRAPLSKCVTKSQAVPNLVAHLQWCWAHLMRDFQKWKDHPDARVKRLGCDLLRETRKLFELWHKVRDGTLTCSEFVKQMKPVQSRVHDVLLRGEWLFVSGSCRVLHEWQSALRRGSSAELVTDTC